MDETPTLPPHLTADNSGGDPVLPDRARKGRGAVGNPDGRFEPHTRAAVDDGWWRDDDSAWGEGDPPPIPTTVTTERPKTIITRNTSPDVPFDRSINPYRGCEHGCVYCFARPTHAYHGLSPGLDFETRLFAKPDAAALLSRELGKARYRPAPIAMGTNTDPYQPIDRDLELTRQVLEVLHRCHHPVTIVTKSALILRDLDLLAPMAERGLARVAVSVTTLNGPLARALEPRAAAPGRRLKTIRALAAAGVPVAVMAAPLIPALNDSELERILAAAADAGATSAGYILLRLPLELKDLFGQWLDVHYPDRKARVLNRLREARDGNLYVSGFGTRMKGTGQHADLYAKRFALACKTLGLHGVEDHQPLRTDLFVRPRGDGRQMDLF